MPTQIAKFDREFRILKEKQASHGGAIIKLEIYRSGKTVDGRIVTRQDILEIVKNTNEHMLSKGYTVPLKFGHFDDGQELKGEIIGLTAKRRKRKAPDTVSAREKGKQPKKPKMVEMSLIAEVSFYEVAYKLWREETLKNVSVEVAENGFTEDGTQFGQYLAGLALLGTDPPALPWVGEFNEADYMSACNDHFENDGSIYYYCAVPGKNYNQQGGAMEELIAQLTAALEAAQAIADAGGEEEPPTDDDMGAEPDVDLNGSSDDDEFDKDPRVIELRAQAAKVEEYEEQLKADEAFNSLHSDQRVTQTDKEAFTSLAKSAGVQVAFEHYSKLPKVKAPPKNAFKSKNLPDKQVEEPWKEHYSTFKARYDKSHPRESDDKRKKRAEMAAKIHMNNMGGK